MTGLRLFLRGNRYEVAGFAVLALGVLIASAGLVLRLANAGIPDACWAQGPGRPAA